MDFIKYLLKDYESSIAHFYHMNSLEPENIVCLSACFAQLGRVADARKAADEFRFINGITYMNETDWHLYWEALFKFKDQKPIGHLIEGLRKASLVQN